MAIRYSGDVEVRMTFLGEARVPRYDVTVRTPRGRWTGKGVRVPSRHAPQSPSAYDLVARSVLVAIEKGMRGGKLPLERGPDGRSAVIRRVFQAPCPIRSFPVARRASTGAA